MPWAGETAEGPGVAGALSERTTLELRGRDAVGVGDNLAGCDLRFIRDQRLELLVADPCRNKLVDCWPCSDVSKRPSDLKTPLPASMR